MFARRLALALILLVAAMAYADDPGFRISSPGNACTTVFTTPTAGQSLCFEASTSLVKRWSGAAWVDITTNLLGKLVLYNNATPTDGQLLIGGTAAGNWTAGTLTDGAGVHAANGNNTITPQLSAYNAAGTRTNDVHIVQDTATLVAGTVTVTLSGAAVFTNATSYTCVAEDDSAIATTRVQQTSGTSITFTGTGTDVVRFICVGS